ncbi:MAG: D-2-hydroxyacid dehydrogenase [Oscillospiraceae bacterium]|nr:D-2-hydroxyacid dehydrogenase [Oscillospiraceae bacterium]
MKIVILDGYTANPGDLSWEEIARQGELTVYDRTAPSETVERIGDAEVVFTNKVLITKDVMDACPKLRLVSVLATGYNVVDLAAAKERGIAVCNVPAYSTRDVAQMTFALLLELCHRVGHHSATVHEGRWTASKDFCYWDYAPVGLAGKTIGLVGFGAIGRTVAKIAEAFSMEVLVYSRTVRPEYETEHCRFCSLGELLEKSDVVSLHCPLTEQTERLIREETLAKMKDGAILLNTGRGPLVDEQAVAGALERGKLSGYAADVVCKEPIPADSPLLGAKNCFLTPHIAWATKDARERLLKVSAENLRAFAAGKPQNVVN